MDGHREYDALVMSYTHLRDFPRQDEALRVLKKIASLVKPIMRARGWKVRELCEFYPEQRNLLGLNVNRGQKILLRLRHPGDQTQFVPIEQVTDTMLHELSHIVHGPHDAKFHALWDQLRDEHEGLVMKGYSGEGFLSKGHKLGGGGRGGGSGRVPMTEARRLARAAAEQRAKQAALTKGSGQRLGGAPLWPGQDIRRVITDAVERRNKIDRGCGSTSYSDKEIQSITETATKNGFRTQAEEDAANEAAIAQALWELVQEDEKRKHGDAYIPPSAEFPAGSHGAQSSSTPPPVPEWSRPPVPETAPPFTSGTSAPKNAASEPSAPLPANGWTCEICTLHNPPNYLSCDACGSQRPESVTRRIAEQERKATAATRPSNRSNPLSSKDLTHSRLVSLRSSNSGANNKPPPGPTGPAFWECSRCGNVVERQWWSCGQCGNVKESSK